MKKAIILGLAFALVPALAQTTPPTWADGILAWLAANSGMVSGAVIVLEALLRLIPSDRALSVLVPVSYAVKAIAKLLEWLASSVLDPLAQAANNVKPPTP